MASTYGWKHLDILDLTAKQFLLYLQLIPRLNAVKQLQAFEVSMLPHMDTINQRTVLSSYREILKPPEEVQEDIDNAWAFVRAQKGKR